MHEATIAVLGAGSWGTAVAIHFARCGHPVLLWGHHPEHVQQMAVERHNHRYLPNISFPERLLPTVDLSQCLSQAELVIVAVPSHAFATLLAQITPKPAGLAWLTKGLDPSSHQLLSDLIIEKWGDDMPMAIISGPSFAQEVAQGLPTALTIAGNQTPFLQTIHKKLHQQSIRAYITHDLVGVQLCGAIKNVLAIACGISDGLHYGANAKAALITRGLAEMTRLGNAYHACPDTFMGLAGLGDLVLTCTDNQSRNRRFGLLIGEGTSIMQAEQQIGQVVEGKSNAAQVCHLAAKHQIDMPICQEVYALLQGKLTAKQAADNLMNRPARAEFLSKP